MSEKWNYVIDEPRRTELLKGFGVSEKVISLGSGDNVPDSVFDFYCKKPTFKLANQDQEGTEPLVIIFQSQYDEAYGARKNDDKLEFVYFNTRKPEDITVHGDSEQCLLRSLFDDIVDSEYNVRNDIERAADAIGFECLSDTYAFIFAERELAMQGQRKPDMKAYYERRLAYVRGTVKPGSTNPGV